MEQLQSRQSCHDEYFESKLSQLARFINRKPQSDNKIIGWELENPTPATRLEQPRKRPHRLNKIHNQSYIERRIKKTQLRIQQPKLCVRADRSFSLPQPKVLRKSKRIVQRVKIEEECREVPIQPISVTQLLKEYKNRPREPIHKRSLTESHVYSRSQSKGVIRQMLPMLYSNSQMYFPHHKIWSSKRVEADSNLLRQKRSLSQEVRDAILKNVHQKLIKECEMIINDLS